MSYYNVKLFYSCTIIVIPKMDAFSNKSTLLFYDSHIYCWNILLVREWASRFSQCDLRSNSDASCRELANLELIMLFRLWIRYWSIHANTFFGELRTSSIHFSISAKSAAARTQVGSYVSYGYDAGLKPLQPTVMDISSQYITVPSRLTSTQ